MAELGKCSILRRQNLVKKPPFSNRMSERAKGDPKICEILVNKVEKKDLGDWRSNLFHICHCCNLETYPGVSSDASAMSSKEEF